MVSFALACYAVMWFHLRGINARRERGEEEHVIVGMSSDEVAELGDDSPRFRYAV